MESYKLLLDKLLTALGAQTWGHTTQAAAVVRTEIGDIVPISNQALAKILDILTCTLLI